MEKESGTFLNHYGVMGMRWGKRGTGGLRVTRRFNERWGKQIVTVSRYDKRSAFRDLFTKVGKGAATSAVLSLAINKAIGTPQHAIGKSMVQSALLGGGLAGVKKVVDTLEFPGRKGN